jgi:hypothetical protein
MLRSRKQPPHVISDYTLEHNFDAELINLLRKVERVRIHAEGREQFGANRNDLGVHG